MPITNTLGFFFFEKNACLNFLKDKRIRSSNNNDNNNNKSRSAMLALKNFRANLVKTVEIK